MRTIPELLGDVPSLQALERRHRDQIAGCARNRHFAPDELIMREDEPADTFHVIRVGSVALETFVPRRGTVIVETLDAGDLLGWSWLVPPYRIAFDARAIDSTDTIEFDGACLRGKCEDDPALGFALLKLTAAVIVERLQVTRRRLLDLYGKDDDDRGTTG